MVNGTTRKHFKRLGEKHKILRFLIFILIGQCCFAQKWGNDLNPYPIDTFSSKAYYFNTTNFPSNDREINEYLSSYFSIDLQFNYSRTSIGGTHYQYSQIINEVPVYRSFVKVNILKNKQQVQVIALLYDPFSISQIAEKSNSIYFPVEKNSLVPAILNQSNEYDKVYAYDNSLLYESDHRSYVKKDTVAVFKVFNPDPLTSAQVGYGGAYVDNNDASCAELYAEQKYLTCSLKISNDSFLLENDYYFIKDLDIPNTAQAVCLNDTIDFDRSMFEFEDANTYYHLEKRRAHVSSLGFSNLVNIPLDIDAHAYNDAENSSFNEFASPAQLLFGEGGIDDAEDADVLVHEFGHFMSANASPSSNTGLYRKAIDEGFGDYCAASYSRTISDYNWQKVFNWDGNNGSWQGRVANTTKHYPEDIGKGIHKDGELWSSTLMQLWDDLGSSICDSLVFQMLYAQVANTSMVDAAVQFLDADSALFNGAHHDIIYQRMSERGFFPVIDSTKYLTNDDISLINSQEFAMGGEMIIAFKSKSTGTAKIFDCNGKLVEELSFENQSQLNYSNSNLSATFYLLKVSIASSSKTFKILKY